MVFNGKFFKRSFTTILLFLIFYLAVHNKFIMIIFFILICFFTLIEYFNIIKKIFRNDKKKITIVLIISILYLSIIIPQTYIFIFSSLDNKYLFIYFISICIASDMGGYFFGKLFKGKKLTKISPNKTYSGLIGAYFLSFIVLIFFSFKFDISFNFILFTFLISSISQIGDIFFSYLKRKAKIKDTGKILPGHGGILDRIDGIIFALPFSINLLFLFK